MNKNTILQRCIDGEVNEATIAILSCYFPLYKILSQIPSLTSYNVDEVLSPISKFLIKIFFKDHTKRLKKSNPQYFEHNKKPLYWVGINGAKAGLEIPGIFPKRNKEDVSSAPVLPALITALSIVLASP